MMLDSRGDLAAVVLALWCPLFLVAIWVVRRHGFSRQAGWIFIVFLAAIRITGSSMELASESTPQNWLIVASATLQSVGLSPLLFALLGILSQVFKASHLGQRVIIIGLNTLQLIILTGFILAIVGGVKAYVPNSSASDISLGKVLIKVAVGLFVASFVAQVYLIVKSRYTAALSGTHKATEIRLLAFAAAVSAPFIATRVAYSAVGTFSNDSPQFNPVAGNVVILACMALLMELIAACIYLAIGCYIDPSDGLGTVEDSRKMPQFSSLAVV
ncbi:hypothetical protein V499_00143 [Pseudogymnoascus sp. VKM F-103]|nr:hypothetical protein V499_00143 [Pseudogymnoascus sp. VKM F-103]